MTAATNGTAPEMVELTAEQKLDTLIWLHAELVCKVDRVAGALSAMLAQQMQPQVQQAILQRLLG